MPGQPNARRKSYLLLYLVYVFALLEIGSRIFLMIADGGEFLHPETILYKYYPGLGQAMAERIDRDDGYVDILFLGGSVLNPGWTQIEDLLLEKISARSGRPVRIHNLAEGAHTTLDSLYKYRHLADKHFDLVFVYHGINELRANNSPDEMFRDDYSHYAWYRAINLIERHAELEWIAFPYVFARAKMEIGDRLDPPALLPRHSPKPEFTRYGGSIKSADPFGANLQAMIDIARERGEPILLATFAFHVPADYRLDRFEAKTLDYGAHGSAIEIWGEPRNVVTGLLTHNKVVRDKARESETLFVDMAASIPTDGGHFDDICHLTYAGSEAFAENLWSFVDRVIAGAGNP